LPRVFIFGLFCIHSLTVSSGFRSPTLTRRRHRISTFPRIYHPPAVSHAPLAHRFTSSIASDNRPSLTHIDSAGRASMVDIAEKDVTKRSATASGRIYIPLIAYELVMSTHLSTFIATGADHGAEHQAREKSRRKGDTLTVAQLAAIMGCKKTSDLIPLCHPLSLTHVSVTLAPESPSSCEDRHSIICRATVSCEGKTGAEMEALTAVSIGLLTVWDMLKAVAGQDMLIGDIMITHKTGGRGDFERSTISAARDQVRPSSV
jgi:molybdenum cofactor biosynthesis protein MoaC